MDRIVAIGIVDTGLMDAVIEVGDMVAVEVAKWLAAEKGFFVEISSGANICGALKAQHTFGKDKAIAIIFSDRVEQYFSTDLLRACLIIIPEDLVP